MPDHTRPRRVARLIAALSVAMALLIGAQPAFAEECVPTVAAFPPGDWVANGISFQVADADDLSAVVLDGLSAFGLRIDESGEASGTFSMAGEGVLESRVDEGHAEMMWTTHGDLSGTATTIQIDGETQMVISGEVDVSPRENDPFVGQDLYGFGNELSRPFSSQFSPSAANCNQVFGRLGGPVEYGSDAGSNGYFLAVRTSGRAQAVDVQGQLAELLEQAQVVSEMDPLDTDILARFVLDMLQFDSLLVSLESCDPEHELDMGPTWQMLHSVMLHAIRMFLDAADGGAYTTHDVITAMAIWIQGGSLGWRADDCLQANSGDDGAMDLFVRFEDVLLERLEMASDREVDEIRVAAYQYGLPRLIAALEAM